MSLTIRERVPGFEPRWFWQESMARGQWQSMVGKYDALATVARLAECVRDRNFEQRLAKLSTRWPGALREGELIGPEQVGARLLAAQAGLAQSDRPRASWTDGPSQAVICWAELHGLIHDQLVFRRERSRGLAATTSSFADWLTRRGAVTRWPAPARLPALVGPKLRVRGAYLWLAARAGLDLPSLNALLLTRSGHWDRRPEDPEWAHSA